MTYIVITKKNEFEQYVEEFQSSLDGISKMIVDANAGSVHILAKQMTPILNNLQFEFYNYLDEFKEKQTLSTAYYLAAVLGKEFMKDDKNKIIIRGLGSAIFYQRVLNHLLEIKEELVVINLQHIQPKDEKIVRAILPKLLDSLTPKDEESAELLKKFILSIDQIIGYLKLKSK